MLTKFMCNENDIEKIVHEWGEEWKITLTLDEENVKKYNNAFPIIKEYFSKKHPNSNQR